MKIKLIFFKYENMHKYETLLKKQCTAKYLLDLYLYSYKFKKISEKVEKNPQQQVKPHQPVQQCN